MFVAKLFQWKQICDMISGFLQHPEYLPEKLVPEFSMEAW